MQRQQIVEVRGGRLSGDRGLPAAHLLPAGARQRTCMVSSPRLTWRPAKLSNAQAMERLQATKTFLNGDVDVNSLLKK